ncbi:MAG: MucR family transcriptional regulator [Desulfovibrionales bacterium]
MEDALRQALEIVKAQASVRTMTEDEIASMVQKLASQIQGISTGEISVQEEQGPEVDPKNAIREKSVICVECGKTFKVLTKKHLALHGLTPAEYKKKWGYKKGTALIAKGLARERRKKMQDMKLWERRGKNKDKSEA